MARARTARISAQKPLFISDLARRSCLRCYRLWVPYSNADLAEHQHHQTYTDKRGYYRIQIKC